MRKLLFPNILLALACPLMQAQDAYDQFYTAIRSNDLRRLTQLLEKGGNPNVTGGQKMTPLIDAAVVGSVDAMKILLQFGAQIDAQNSFGYTALIYSGGDRQKVELMLAKGADVKLQGAGAPPFGGGPTALLIAAGKKGGAATVQALLAKGADVNATDNRGIAALHSAASIGDLETMDLLMARGADVNAMGRLNTSFSPLILAIMSRQTAAVKLLLAKGAKVNITTPRDEPARVKNGPIDLGGETPLHFAAPYGPPELVKVLLDAGADVNAKNIQGMTPLMWAVASDYQNPEIVRLLLARGADPKIKSRDGETALDLARRLGASPSIQLLGGTTAKPAAIAIKTAELPDVRTALTRGLAIMDSSASSTFLQKGGCVACHAQDAAQMAASSVVAKGIALNGDENRRRILALKPGLEIGALQGAGGEGLLYSLEALRSLEDLSQRATDYAVASLSAQQNDDGSWHGTVPRTPIQDGDFTQTALSVRALAAYAPPSRKTDVARRLEKAREWLLKANPVTSESHAMRMLGLVATGAGAAEIQKAAKALLGAQRADGGWAQREELASDAYATGMVLWALADAGQLKATDAAYQRGVRFLIGTQAPDGSWHVASRAVIRFQPYFDSGFPYEHDQWISSMATGWAARALSLSVEPAPVSAELR